MTSSKPNNFLVQLEYIYKIPPPQNVCFGRRAFFVRGSYRCILLQKEKVGMNFHTLTFITDPFYKYILRMWDSVDLTLFICFMTLYQQAWDVLSLKYENRIL